MFSVYAQSGTHCRFKLMNYCGFNIQPFCSDVCGDHRRPQTLAEMCRNMEHLVRFQVSGRLACVCVFLFKLELPVGYVTTKSNKLINIPMINIISNIGQVFLL